MYKQDMYVKYKQWLYSDDCDSAIPHYLTPPLFDYKAEKSTRKREELMEWRRRVEWLRL